MNFGNVSVGKASAPSTVTLLNGTAKTLQIKGTAIGLNFTIAGTTCSTTLSAGQSCTYQVTFHPGSAGTDNATLKINGNVSVPRVQLHGTGQR